MVAVWSVVVGQNGPMHALQTFVLNYGYVAIFILAMLESMCVPIPSEVIFVFGGAATTLAFFGHGAGAHKPLNLALIIIVGVLGELTGALISYQVGRTAGRTIVDRWGKWLLLTHKDLDSAERWFARFGVFSIPIGRVIPVVRSVISVPAGLAEMGRVRFAALTAIGSAVWITILAELGHAAGASWPKFDKYFRAAEYPIVAVVVLVLGYGFWHRWRSVKAERESRQA